MVMRYIPRIRDKPIVTPAADRAVLLAVMNYTEMESKVHEPISLRQILV